MSASISSVGNFVAFGDAAAECRRAASVVLSGLRPDATSPSYLIDDPVTGFFTPCATPWTRSNELPKPSTVDYDGTPVTVAVIINTVLMNYLTRKRRTLP